MRALIIAACLALAVPVIIQPAMAQVEREAPDGLVREDGKTFYYRNGTPTAGLCRVPGQGWMFFDPREGLVTGWIQCGDDLYYFDPDGTARAGLREIDGDTFLLDVRGRAVTGFVESIEGTRFFSSDTGAMAKGFTAMEDGTRFFDSDGFLQKGFFKTDGSLYYGGSDGLIRKGWQEINGARYYFDESGCASQGLMEIGGKTCFFEAGRAATGWMEVDEETMYFLEDGTGAQGLMEIDGTLRCFEDGFMVRNAAKDIAGQRYVFSADGTGRKAYKNCSIHDFSCGICTKCGKRVDSGEAVKAMLALRDRYPDGTIWNEKSAYSTVIDGERVHVYACEGFALMLQDAAFRGCPVKVHKDADRIRPGDIVIYRTGEGTSHAVAVLEVKDGRLLVAEGNSHGRVVWNRIIWMPFIKENLSCVKTRY